MNCGQAREILSLNFPSPAEENVAQAQAHLRGCRGCQNYLGEDALLRERLRKLPPEKPRAQFKEKLFTEISRLRWEQSRQGQKRKFGRFFSVAAIVVLMGSGWFWLSRESAPPSQLVDYLIEDHQQNLPGRFMTAFSSASEIESWFEGKVDFPLRVPVLEEAEILGARLCRVEGQRAVLVFYRCRSHLLSWFAFPQNRKHGPKDSPAVLTVQGYHLIMWDENGLTHAVVSDMDSGELIRMLSQERG